MKKLYILLCALAMTVHIHSNDYRKKTYTRKPSKIGYQQREYTQPQQQSTAKSQLQVLKNQALILCTFCIILNAEAALLKQ